MVRPMDTTTIRMEYRNPKGDYTRDHVVIGDQASVEREIALAASEVRFARFQQANGNGATALSTERIEIV